MRGRGRPQERSRSYRAGRRVDRWPYEELLVTMQLVRAEGYNPRKAPVIRGPEDVAAMFANMEALPQERMYAVLLNSAGRVVGVVEVGRGSRNEVMVDPTLVFTPALLAGAVAVVLVHNHPSGNPFLSVDDMLTFDENKKAGSLLRIRLEDLIAIGADGSWMSAMGEGTP